MAKTARKRVRSYERKADQPVAITPIEYGGLQEAYDHFNAALFEGGLPDVFITYQRKANSFGYFSPDRFVWPHRRVRQARVRAQPGRLHQPDRRAGLPNTVSRDGARLAARITASPPRAAITTANGRAKMKAIGLQPSSTGMVGGKETGQQMLDYIIPDGPFTKAFAKLAATGWKLNLQSAHRPGAKGGTNSKTKFTCPACGQNAWGKPDLAILCEPCGIKMHAASATARSYDVAA